MRGNHDTAAGVVVCPLPSTSTPNHPKGAWITSERASLRRTRGVGVWSTRRSGPAMELEVEEWLQEEVEGQEQRQPHKGRCFSTARNVEIIGGSATNDLSIGPCLHQATSMVARGVVESWELVERRRMRRKAANLRSGSPGKALAAASMEESDSEEEQNGVQGEELIGGSVAVKVSATLGQAMWETWHRRLAYVVVSTLEVMHKEKCVHGPQLQGDGASVGSSEACMQNKSARFPFPRAEGSAHLPLEVVQMDLVGPMRTEGTGGVLYFLTMVDKWSCLTWARPLSKKSGAAAAIKEDWLQMVEWQVMWLVNVLRSDHGGEFLGAEFTKFLRRNGIRHQLTCPGTPQQNGIAEHANRTIGEAAKTLLGAAGMPYKFWPEAVRHIITVNNRVLTHIGDKHWVPYERWLGKKPSIDMLRVWGCMRLVMVPKEQRHKLEVADEWQHQQPVQIGLRLQEIERSAVEEVQLHLEDLPGSELTSDHSGGAEQQGADPATEDGLEDESAHLDSPSQLKLGATAKVTKRSLERGASPHGQQTATRKKRVASATFKAEV
ncbi:unnamed protein product [Closterium sp. NIES-53]